MRKASTTIPLSQYSRAATKDRMDTSVPCVVICPGYHGHSIARSLGRLGIAVYGVHSDARSPSASSTYWRKNFVWNLSKHSIQESVTWFRELADKIGSRPILIPTDDHSCLFVDDNSESLLERYLFPKQPYGLARSLSNKQKLFSLCKEMSIPTPVAVFPQSREDVLDCIKDITFPVMLKGIDTVKLQKQVGVRMVIVKDAKTLLRLYDEMESNGDPNLMIQEYIAGDAKKVWMFDGYFDDESNCLFGVTARKVRQYPAYTGMTSLGICENNEALKELITEFMKFIGYHGVLDIGYKYDKIRGKYFLLDPNPRVGITFRLFVDSNGMDVVRALYRNMTGQPVNSGETRNGRKWLSEPFDIISSTRYWRDKNLNFSGWVHSFKGVEEAQWFARDDLNPFLRVWIRSLQQFLFAKR